MEQFGAHGEKTEYGKSFQQTVQVCRTTCSPTGRAQRPLACREAWQAVRPPALLSACRPLHLPLPPAPHDVQSGQHFPGIPTTDTNAAGGHAGGAKTP